jgi:hypothetical protein
MRTTAIILNVILIVTMVFLIAIEGMPEGKGTLLVILIVVAPICSLIVLFGAKGEAWLSLYFKRKALEEKQKIEQLTKK